MEFTLDHVVLAVPDLHGASAALEQRLGLRASPGGRHPNLGTENALVPLGGAYLELVAVADEEVAASTVFGRAALAARRHGPRFAGWVARVDDLDAAAEARGERVVPMSRLTPGGERVTWRMAGAERLGVEGGVPALISWDDPATAPPFAPPLHPVGPVSLDHVEIGDPDGELRRLLPVVDAVRVVPDGPATVHDVVVVTGDGQLLITAEALRDS